MKELNKLLDKFDLGLKDRKTYEIYIISVIIMVLVGLVTYQQIIPKQQKKITKFELKLSKLEKTNKNFKKAVKDNNEEKQMLKEVERENDELEVEINKKKNSLDYILTKIKKQNTIKYSDKQWGLFYKTIQEKAIKHNLTLLSIKNKEIKKVVPKIKKDIKTAKPKKGMKKVEKVSIKPKKKEVDFKPVFEINLEVVASFKDLLNFLVDIEKNKLITNTDSLKLYSFDDQNLKATIKINLWGVR